MKYLNSKSLSNKIKIESLKMVYRSGGSHIGSALSFVDIISVLYSDIMNFDPKNPGDPNRDKFILSKGHGCSSLYACLAIIGFFDLNKLKTYGKNGSTLMNHVSHKVPGVEFSTGSLGHGLPFSTGIAKALKIKKKVSNVYVLIGDGELAEGSNFEAMLFASHHCLDNLILIIDYNNLQSLTTVDKTLNIEPINSKFLAFGWDVFCVDGHNHQQIRIALENAKNANNSKPKVIIANTIKGFGVSFMENKVDWHYKSPNETELKEAFKEIIYA